MIKNYFKTTFRNLWKNKGYSFLNICGLAIGIACAGLIFLWAEDEFTFDNTNVKKDRLYQLNVNMAFWAEGVVAILIALITISFQSIKVAIANPVKSLRTE